MRVPGAGLEFRKRGQCGALVSGSVASGEQFNPAGLRAVLCKAALGAGVLVRV